MATPKRRVLTTPTAFNLLQFANNELVRKARLNQPLTVTLPTLLSRAKLVTDQSGTIEFTEFNPEDLE